MAVSGTRSAPSRRSTASLPGTHYAATDHVILNQGTIYISLVRLEERGWIRSKWGVSENNRRARFYAITKAGEKALAAETENWERIAAMIGRVLADPGAES